jgi:transcriptional regulator with GAF, ATPase, and Fis domain
MGGRGTISWCCLAAASKSEAHAVARAAAQEYACEEWSSADGIDPAPLVLAFLGNFEPDTLEQLAAIAQRRPGRVLAASLPEAGAVSLSCAMRLLKSGIGDVVSLDAPDADALAIAILNRWALIDAIVASDLLVQNVVGRSRAWTSLLRQVVEAARFSQAPALVIGETGTGKELIARLVHALDPRRAPHDLIVVDCATLAPELAGSELFGHERGAFTGAVASRDGAFALANRGTLFLDEIGDLPLPLQGHLLRAIQERIYKPVGANAWAKSDFRLVCATNRDLKDDVNGHRFRSDLYHRIAGITCRTPALRERVEDIPALALHFLREALGDHAPSALSGPVLEYVVAREYQGNVRDLRLLMHAMARRYMGTGSLTVGGIPEEQRADDGTGASGWQDETFEQAVKRAVMLGAPLKDIGRAAEETAVRFVLSEANSTGEAAKRLGVSARAVQARRRAWRAE